MAYIETIKRGNQNFYYLTKTLRLKNNKFKKIRYFLGRGELPQKKLEHLANLAKEGLKEKSEQVKKINKIYRLDDVDRNKLYKIKKTYNSIIKKLSNIEYNVIEKQHLIKFTFNTNAIEGSTINIKETAHILDDGITPPNHDLREIHEIENTKKAYEFMKKYKGKVNVNFVKKIHFHLTYNILEEQAGKFRSIQVYVAGSKHTPTKTAEIKKNMGELTRWIINHKDLHPIVLASYVHHFFIAIHPFIDGNGRTGRLLLNFMLMKARYPPICIGVRERIRYIDCLENARDGNINDFIDFIIKKVEEAHKEIVDTVRKK